VEVEAQRREESRTTLQNGAPLLTDFGDNLQAASTRLARLRAGRVVDQPELVRARRAALGRHRHQRRRGRRLGAPRATAAASPPRCCTPSSSPTPRAATSCA
jgi:hypothetical protein